MPSATNARGERHEREALMAPVVAALLALGGAWAAEHGAGLVVRAVRDEVRVAGALDDRVELRAVVGDEADALQGDVIRPPALALQEHAIVDRDRRALFRHDQGPHHGAVTVHRLAEILDLLAGVILDLRDVRLLEQVAEETRELLALRGGSRLPVLREAPPGDLAEVEDLVRHGADRPPTLQRPRLFLELGIRQDFHHEVDRRTVLVRGRAGQRVGDHEQRHSHAEREDEETGRGHGEDTEASTDKTKGARKRGFLTPVSSNQSYGVARVARATK